MTGGAGELNQGALQPRLVGLAPVDLEAVPTAVTPHRGGMSFERLAFAAAGTHGVAVAPARRQPLGIVRARHDGRSEEHTSELQSPFLISYAVFCLKIKKKKWALTIVILLFEKVDRFEA